MQSRAKCVLVLNLRLVHQLPRELPTRTFCLCSRCDRMNNRCPGFSPQPRTGCCSICPTSSRTNKLDVRTSHLLDSTFSPPDTRDPRQVIQEPHSRRCGKAILSTNGQIAFCVAHGTPFGISANVEMEFEPVDQMRNAGVLRPAPNPVAGSLRASMNRTTRAEQDWHSVYLYRTHRRDQRNRHERCRYRIPLLRADRYRNKCHNVSGIAIQEK